MKSSLPIVLTRRSILFVIFTTSQFRRSKAVEGSVGSREVPGLSSRDSGLAEANNNKKNRTEVLWLWKSFIVGKIFEVSGHSRVPSELNGQRHPVPPASAQFPPGFSP
jgi:hypothetical protein